MQCVFVRKSILFDALSPIVLTKTNENDVENGGFRKLSKVEPFDNAPFPLLVWIGEKGGLWKRCREKRHILPPPSAFSDVLVWTKGENVSKVYVFKWKRICVDKWKETENASVGKNILLLLVKMKTDTFKNLTH